MKYQYMTMTLHSTLDEDKLNNYGQGGWKLVSCFPVLSDITFGVTKQSYVYIFMRER
jgi:hypothetical protein